MKKIIVFFILGVFLISGCQIPEEVKEKPEETKPEIKTKIEPAQKIDYTIENLQEDINSLFERTNYDFIQDKEDPEYYIGNGQKFYVINVFDEEIQTSTKFYDKFSAQNWKGNLHFLNKTAMRLLHPPLTEKNFTHKNQYMDYVQNRALIEQITIEKQYDLENGKVLEYQFINWMYDPYNQFQGAWEDTLLIYKIYCSPNLVVFIRPGWEKIQLGVLGQKIDETYKNWELTVERLRPEFLDISNKILKLCPVSKSFFNNLPDQEFKTTTTLAYYYKTDLQYYWNLTTDISTEIEPSSREGEYLLKRINVIFTNYEDSTIWGPLLLDIETLADGKDEATFVSEKSIGKFLRGGKSVSRSFVPITDQEFSDTITIDIELYTEEGHIPIRPRSITIDTNNKLIKG